MSVYNILLFILQYYITSRILSMHLMQHAGVVFLILYILQYFLQLYRNILYILHQYKVYNTGNFITHRNNMIYIYITHIGYKLTYSRPKILLFIVTTQA